MEKPSRHAAFLAYLLPIIGWLYVFIFHRDNEFAVFHAKQAIALTVFVILAPILWAIFGWVMLWVPAAGGIIAAATFTIVMMVFFGAFFVWIVGMINAVRERMVPLPIFGGLAERFLR